MPFPQALTIAGSDSGGGAGIQADIKTMQMRGVFATSVLTAITAQNTRGVSHIEMASVASVRAQLAAIAADFDIAAHKIGMLGTAEMIACVADCLRSCRFGALVLDPVMVAKGGAPLLQHDAIAALKTHLLPRADLVTPNLPEAELLSGHAIRSEADVAHAAASLLALGAKGVVIKGGHWQEPRLGIPRRRDLYPRQPALRDAAHARHRLHLLCLHHRRTGKRRGNGRRHPQQQGLYQRRHRQPA